MIDISILTYDKSCKMNKKHDGNDFHICILSLEAEVSVYKLDEDGLDRYTKPLLRANRLLHKTANV